MNWLFGGLLPWFGWRTMPCYWDGEPVLYLDADQPEVKTGWEADFLTVEWFFQGATLLARNIRMTSAKGEADHG